jgi:GT2 family glycosyltransferase
MDAPDLPSASVVVAVYNGADTLEDCLQSLRALDYPPERLQLIAIDNGSRDATAAILERHRDRVVIGQEARRGAGAARNAGIRIATGEVVAFTDADCVVDPAWLCHLVRPLADPRVGIAGGTIRARPPVNVAVAYGERIHDHRRAIEEYRPSYAISMSWASPRALLERVGGFDPSFLRGQDVDLAYRIQQAGYRLAFAAEAVIYHRNESTLRGLFHEGFLHGLYGVKVNQVHAAYLRGFGYRRVNTRSYRRLLRSGVKAARGPDRAQARCDLAFNLGKKVGKVVGLVRFRHVDL